MSLVIFDGIAVSNTAGGPPPAPWLMLFDGIAIPNTYVAPPPVTLVIDPRYYIRA
jgi:hypothetical protein